MRIVIAALVWTAACADPAPERLPVIDMHLHALTADANGPPPLGLCAPFPEYPLARAAETWEKTFIDWQKKPPCPDPVGCCASGAAMGIASHASAVS